MTRRCQDLRKLSSISRNASGRGGRWSNRELAFWPCARIQLVLVFAPFISQKAPAPQIGQIIADCDF
jgi:hypothetical protein